MGIFGKLRGEFIDIVEWLDSTQDTMVYRFERQGNEIKNGAQLVVRPGQVAVFVNEGQVADQFEPGTYTLETKNLPILSTLQGWKYGFNSPFKAEVYFFSTKIFTGLKWGTSNPVLVRDPELGGVRIRAYGSYTMRITEAEKLLTQLVSTDDRFETGEVTEQLRGFAVQQFVGWLGKCGLSIYDFAAHYVEIGGAMRDALKADFEQYGLEVTQVAIENISMPPEVEAALDKRTQMGIVGDLTQYTRFQAANAIEESAKNPGGGGGAMEMGVGLALGQQVARDMQQSGAPAGAATPPPVPVQTDWFVAVNGQQQGPFNAATLQQRIAAGTVDRTTLVWRAGMAGWQPAGDVAEVSSLFAAVPPPLPPAL